MKQLTLTTMALLIIATVACSGSGESGTRGVSKKAKSGGDSAVSAAGKAAAATIDAYEESPPVIADAKVEVGKPFPDIEGVDTDGTKFKLSDYLGKVVMLDFWGDW